MKKQAILCVDDERIVLTGLKEQLRVRLGGEYNIEIAENGEDALEILDELLKNNITVPVVISDYIMPGMKGDELLIQIHQLCPDSMKILLTGQATLDGVTNAINNANLYRYISKPWDVEDLTLTVNEAIKSYEKDRKIEEQNLELTKWADAFVEAMGATLDLRDTTTSGHSRRLASYAIKTAKAINNVDYGELKDVYFNADEIRELYYAALLHDIGKMGIREHILLKEHRISNDREMAIIYRLNWYHLSLSQKDDIPDSEKIKLQNNISGYIDLISSVNSKECLTDEDINAIKQMAAIKYFDVDGIEKDLLDDFEVENLTVKYGNLTMAERKSINSHVELTHDILNKISWPSGMEHVSEIAASHHERLNGSGYFRGLKGDDISIQSRILAILDVFEALTSPDRPYKKQKTAQEAFNILQTEVNSGNLDKDIFEVFVKEKVYEQ